MVISRLDQKTTPKTIITVKRDMARIVKSKSIPNNETVGLLVVSTAHPSSIFFICLLDNVAKGKQYEESTGKIAGAYFFNGKEYGRGSKILYPNFKEMDFKIGVAFAKDASSLKHGKNTDYNMEIEECQNISMREDMETIENILDQVIEARSVVVLSDFSLERQMEIAGEASLEHFEEILDLLLQKQSESDLVVGSVTCYEGTLEDRANRIEQRRQKYSEYEQKCLEEIEQLTKQRDEALEKQEVKK